MYCGWQTRGARLRWAAAIFFLLAFVALGIMYAVVSEDCYVCEDGFSVNNSETGEAVASYDFCTKFKGSGPRGLIDVENCNKAYVVGSFMGFVVSAVLALIPCCAMCCASSPADMAANERAMAMRASAAQRKQAPNVPTAPPAAARPGDPDPPQKSRFFGFARKASKPQAAADPLSQPAF